jgi:DNA-3-methyladenine glycosylase
MFEEPGHAYVYFIYGCHFCVNVVCQPAGVAEAILIRAIQPAFGLPWMQRKRQVTRPTDLTNGPGKLCQALGIRRDLNGVDLCNVRSELFIGKNPNIAETIKNLGPVVITTRIGITKAATLPLRFYLDGSSYESRRVARTA